MPMRPSPPAGRPRRSALQNRSSSRLPRHHGAATVSVAAAALTGAGRGLDAYERWLAATEHEDGFVLEPVALATLRALAAESTGIGIEARKVLVSTGGLGSENATVSVEEATRREARSLEGELAKAQGGNKLLLLRALADTGHRDSAPQVAALLKDPVPEHRAAAAEALGVLGATEVVPQLQPLLKDPAGEVRAAAAIALHRLGDPSGDGLVSELLSSGIPDLQLQAAEGMAADPAANWAPYVEPLLASDAPMTRLSAARLLLPVAPERARQAIGTLLSEANPVVVGEMAKTLAEQHIADLPTIRKLLRHGSAEARHYGAVSLLRLTGALR